MNELQRDLEMIATGSHGRDTVQGRVLYLLIFVGLLHFIYPITLNGATFNLIAYQVLYTLMFIAGIWVASDSRWHLLLMLTLGVLWLTFAVAYALDPASSWKILATYAVLSPFQAMLNLILLQYIFKARVITRDVLYAAITVYILLAAMFVPIYGSLEILQPGSFIDNGRVGQPVFWQQFIYFSLTTLTTTGYGDIIPVSGWARAFANLEQVIGVLYIAMLMARLVSLYSSDKENPK